MTGTRKDHFELGIKLSARGKYAEAVKEYEQVGTNDPNFNQAQTNLKWISYWTGLMRDKSISGDKNRRKPQKLLSQRLIKKR
ncbi:hypothetical protein MYX78_01790 [Acidobacteria bacterium AH-259-G07]|nr:hypothetical protein [Acidobacteria bacterium AH-259-G07]